jgi:DNA-binding protein Fis
MFWKKKLKPYAGKNSKYSIRNVLKREKKLPDDFEFLLNTLTLEELIYLKLDISNININNKLYNLPIWKNLIHIVKECCLKYALSSTRTKSEAACFLGIDEKTLNYELKKYKIESFFHK